MIRILIAALALICVALPAEARQHYVHATSCIETGSVMFPVCGMVQPFSGAQSIRVTMHKERGASNPRVVEQETVYANPIQFFNAGMSKPARFIAGRLVCAVNVGVALAERGIKGTGSAAALSYLHWGRSAGGPVPGAVIVSSRKGGGHVAIVSRVVNGVTYAWNASGHSGWVEIPYHRPVLDYRIPG